MLGICKKVQVSIIATGLKHNYNGKLMTLKVQQSAELNQCNDIDETKENLHCIYDEFPIDFGCSRKKGI